jgi:hypothetical protein
MGLGELGATGKETVETGVEFDGRLHREPDLTTGNAYFHRHAKDDGCCPVSFGNTSAPGWLPIATVTGRASHDFLLRKS